MFNTYTEQDWCPNCNQPVDIVEISEEFAVTRYGEERYFAIHLECGHSLSVTPITERQEP